MALTVARRTAAAQSMRLAVVLTPSRRLYFLGGILCVALAVCARGPSGKAPPGFLMALAVAGVAYLIAVREFFQTREYPRRVVFVCLALAILWRVPLLLKPAASEDDVRRYVWDGRLQKLGYNPYVVIPSDPVLAALHTSETRGLNNSDVPTPYPAGAELFFRAVTLVHESTLAFKVAFVLCDLAIMLVLLDTLRRAGQPQHWVLAYAWHPLVATEVAGSGHVDIVGVLLLLISLAALGRRWRATSAITFALAVAVKLLPIVLAPLYWKRVRIRDGLLAVLVVALVYVPFFERIRLPIGSLGIMLRQHRFNSPIFVALERLAGAHVAAGVTLFAGLVIATWLRSKNPSWSSTMWAWPMASSLACAPIVYPWYLLWLVPFLRSPATLPLIVWSLSTLFTYFAWYLHSLGQPFQLPIWVMGVEYGLVALAAAFALHRNRVQSGRLASDADS